jgi:hypothetical protein
VTPVHDALDMDIDLFEGDYWDDVSEDVLAVCRSVAECFAPAIAEKPVGPILVERKRLSGFSLKHRLTPAETGKALIWVYVPDRDRADWPAPLAYDFAYEFCGVLGNLRPQPLRPLPRRLGCINASLCEMGAMFALRAMSRASGDSHASRLTTFLDSILGRPEHTLPAGKTFTVWLASVLPSLEKDYPYAIEKHKDYIVIARQLLPIFEADTEAWRAIRYLDLWDIKGDPSFAEYFSAWRSVTPSMYHDVLDRIRHSLSDR